MPKIKLPKRTLDHIITRHPEVAAYIHRIVEAAQDPDLVIKGLRGELKALKFYTNLHIGPKYLVVIYREVHREKLLNCLTSSIAKVKGEIIWKKSL
ncbi:hypothetical protein [Candidatus Methanodesulfokora washburnensis]|jgi:hypothetical protein|uniref:Uncharacterized protein n=1 Tax=Candidatus Methanodesulfokora washburnensis TaxID=2478471 RepID=A0A3R9PIX1_9CREN|nr:hypothetical protein [Candidatus Methanodesulfokores washburnensis]RSN75404.1 hypothetical protein D6D85_06310 [Candidatus Methanodesulfokores washburnensis]